MLSQIEPKLGGRHQGTCRFRIAQIIPFQYPRWSPWQPSWNLSNHFSSQTLIKFELKLIGATWKLRTAKIVPFWCPRWWLSWKSSTDICSPTVSQIKPSNWRPGGRGFSPCRGLQHSFVEMDREIFSAVILSLPLIQEGQLSVSGERMCTILVNRLED